MSRFDFRGGISPIKTAEELSVIIPLVVLFIIGGSAQARFPNSDRSSPSPWVAVVIVRVGENPPPRGFPLYIHWTQWERLVVPLLKEAQTSTWRGSLPTFGEILYLLNNIVGPCGEIILPKGEPFGSSPGSHESIGRLYGCDPSDLDRVGGKTLEYLHNLRERTLSRAKELGY
jgi:hypothetical protein